MPTCKRRHCPKTPKISANAEILSQTGHLYTDVAILGCVDGYEATSKEAEKTPVRIKMSCGADGQWKHHGRSSPDTWACVKRTCKRPPEVKNAVLSLSFAEEGIAVAEYDCSKGYQMRGAAKHKCVNGSWSTPESSKLTLPRCVIGSCRLPPKIPFMLFRPATEEDSRRRRHARHLSKNRKVLWADASDVSNFIDHKGSSSRGSGPWEAGEELILSCSAGYELVVTNPLTPDMIFCRADGSWGVNLPTCVPISCPSPPAIPNAQLDLAGLRGSPSLQNMLGKELQGSAFRLGTQVKYECLRGYVRQGSNDALVCAIDGQWKPPLPGDSFPECVEARCPPLEISEPLIMLKVRNNVTAERWESNGHFSV